MTDSHTIELDKAARRSAIRAALKQEYYVKYFNPFRMVHATPVLDSGLQRYMAARAKQHEFFKVSWPSARLFLFNMSQFAVFIYVCMQYRLKREGKLRRGEVAPRDRPDRWLY